MRVAISNDLKTLYGRIDYSILQRTKSIREFAVGSSAVTVNNTTGFNINDFVILGDPGSDKAELLQISAISGQQINFTGSLVQNHDKKSDLYGIKYNQIKLYEDDVLIDTVTITPDFWVSSAYDVSVSNYYHITFYNSTTAAETAAGEKIKGYNKLLCSIADVYQWETADSIDNTILDKIEIATREILSVFINQGQDIGLLVNYDVLRIACACLALKYYYMSHRKSENDISTLKSADYSELYKAKLLEATTTINRQEDDVKVFGQTRVDR